MDVVGGVILSIDSGDTILNSKLSMVSPELQLAGKPVDRKVRERIERDADQQCLLRLFEIPDDEVQIFFDACDVVVLPYS